MTPMNLGLAIGGIAFLVSCILWLFQAGRTYVIYPALLSFLTGLILIPLGFYKELGYLSLGFGMLVPSFFGVIAVLCMRYASRLR